MTEYELPLIYISPSFGNKKRKRFDANVGGVFFSGDTEQEAREKAEQYIRDHGWFSFAEVERIKAQGALEEHARNCEQCDAGRGPCDDRIAALEKAAGGEKDGK